MFILGKICAIIILRRNLIIFYRISEMLEGVSDWFDFIEVVVSKNQKCELQLLNKYVYINNIY